MPLYEYRCTKCGHETEVLQKFSDKPLRKCGECSGKLEKLISRTSFQLKGGGWYAQGYGGKSGGASDSKSEKTSSTSSTSSSTTDKKKSKPSKAS